MSSAMTLSQWLALCEPTISELLDGLASPAKDAMLEAYNRDATDMMDITFHLLRNQPGMGTQEASRLWILGNLFAKFRGNGNLDPEMVKAAMDGYVQRNQRCREITLPPKIIVRMKQLLSEALPFVDDDPEWRFGPGAVYERLDAFQRWRVTCPDSDPAAAIATEERELLDGSSLCRLCAVQKNAKKARLITVEPALASFWQQHTRNRLLKSIHEGPLRGSCEDLFFGGRSEEYQRRRCIRASATGQLSTVDLKDASDSIPWSAVEDCFPPWVVQALACCRSWFFIEPGGAVLPTYMFAGMGNASTFAVETLYFWALLTACAEVTFGLCHKRAISVFGDDIVLPTSFMENQYYVGLIADCGLIVNERKTCMNPGPGFREACGCAALNGTQLTPAVQVKGPYVFGGDDISLCELTTRLDLSCWELGHLASRIIDEADLKVLHTPSPVANVNVVTSNRNRRERGTIRKRWRSGLQLWEYRLKTRIPLQRVYSLDSFGPTQALAVLSRQVGTSGVRHGRVEVRVDLPHQIRIVERWIRFYPDPTFIYRW